MKNKSAVIALACLLAILFPAKAMTQQLDKPDVVRAVAPLFPLIADNSYALGSVIVEVQINAAGTVTKAHAIQGHPLLGVASEKAAQRWLFAATTDEAKLRTVRLTFVFTLIENYRTADEDLSPIFMPPFKIEVRRKVPVVVTREP